MLLMVYRTPGASRERRHTDTSTGGLMVEPEKKTKKLCGLFDLLFEKNKNKLNVQIRKCVPAKHARL